MARRKSQQGMPRASFTNMQQASDGRIVVIAVSQHIDAAQEAQDRFYDSADCGGTP